jgi:hypothetical protein
LLDLLDVFGAADGADFELIEIRLFEFSEIGRRRNIYPAIAILDDEAAS